jgi:tellurite resistance protein
LVIKDFEPTLYFRLLAAVAAADGVIKDSEVSCFAELIELGGGDATVAQALCDEAMDSRAMPLWFFDNASVSRPFAKRMIRDGLILAASDGYPAHSERNLLANAAALLGIDAVGKKIRGLPSEEPNLVGTPTSPLSVEELSEVLERATADIEDFRGDVYFRLLAAVAAADSVLQSAEVERLGALMVYAGVEGYLAETLFDDAMRTRHEPLWFLPDAEQLSDSFVDVCLRDASVMAYADGEITALERNLLRDISNALGRPNAVLPSPTESTRAPAYPVVSQAERRQTIDRGLATVSAVLVLGGGAYAVTGPMGAGLAASLTYAATLAMWSWVAPVLLLIAAGMASVVLHLIVSLSDDEESERR